MLSYIFVLDALVYLRWEVGGAGGGGGTSTVERPPRRYKRGKERRERTSVGVRNVMRKWGVVQRGPVAVDPCMIVPPQRIRVAYFGDMVASTCPQI